MASEMKPSAFTQTASTPDTIRLLSNESGSEALVEAVVEILWANAGDDKRATLVTPAEGGAMSGGGFKCSS